MPQNQNRPEQSHSIARTDSEQIIPSHPSVTENRTKLHGSWKNTPLPEEILRRLNMIGETGDEIGAQSVVRRRREEAMEVSAEPVDVGGEAGRAVEVQERAARIGQHGHHFLLRGRVPRLARGRLRRRRRRRRRRLVGGGFGDLGLGKRRVEGGVSLPRRSLLVQEHHGGRRRGSPAEGFGVSVAGNRRVAVVQTLPRRAEGREKAPNFSSRGDVS